MKVTECARWKQGWGRKPERGILRTRAVCTVTPPRVGDQVGERVKGDEPGVWASPLYSPLVSL